MIGIDNWRKSFTGMLLVTTLLNANSAELTQEYESARNFLGGSPVKEDLPRRALIIAAERYENFPPAVKAESDAYLVKAVLEEARFEVDMIEATDHDILISRVEEFSQRLSSTNEDHSAIAAIYFVGHGFQYQDGQYFVPMNASSDPRQLRLDSVPVSFLIEELVAKKSAYTIVFLDSCRVSLFPNDSDRGFRPYSRDFRRDKKAQVFYGFATTFDSYAYGPVYKDGANGPFARALESKLNVPGELLHDVFGYIATETNRVSKDMQLPHYSKPPGNIYLHPTWQQQRELKGELNSAIMAAVECVEQYVSKHPAGSYSLHARRWLKRFSGPQVKQMTHTATVESTCE